MANGVVTFTPTPDYHGPASFTYTISDSAGGTATATVSLTVTPVNDAPIANPDNGYTTPEDTAVDIDVDDLLTNDTDIDSNPLTVTGAGGTTGGTVELANGTFTYTPTANYNGTDSFTYRATDGAAAPAIATVTITVTPVNDAPVATNDAYTTNEDTPLTIAAPACWPTTPTSRAARSPPPSVTGPSHGTLDAERRRLVHLHARRQLQRPRQLHLPGQRRHRPRATSPPSPSPSPP